MKKRSVSLMAVLVLFCVMLAGCVGGNSSSKKKGSVSDEWKTYQEKSGNSDPVKVTWWLVGGADEYYKYYWSEMKGLKKIQEICGVDIDFQVAQNYDVYLPMITSQTYPDIITGYNLEKYRGRLAAMYHDGVSVKLDNYMKDWMPNFSNIVSKYPKIGQDMRLDTGEYTFVCSMFDIGDEEDRIAASERGLAIRQDWLDEIGMDIPETIEDWFNVLCAFKKYDPNGNKLQDEEPVNMCSSNWKYFLTAYGIDDDPSVNKDGKVVYGFMTEEYKAYLEELNKWNKEELIYNMFENTSIEKMEERVTQNYAGAWKGDNVQLEDSDPNSFISKLRQVAPNAEIVACPWPKLTKDSHQWCFSDISSISRETTVITSKAVSDDVDKAAAYLLDYMISESGSNYLNWGIEGESYEVKNGKKVIKDDMKDSVEFHGTQIEKFNTYADPITVMLPQFGEMADYILSNKSESYYDACKVWAQGDTSYKMQAPCQMSVEQAQKAGEYEDKMKDYISRMRMKFITGKEPLTSYDAYVSQVKIMGGDDYVKIWQDAYDSYMKR